jgi:hypothetical protein
MIRGQRAHEPIAERLDRLSDWEPMSGCRLWIGAKIWGGYGRLRIAGKHVLAHRAAYEDHTGYSISADLTVDHLCRNRACINPKHLEVVTQMENVHRGEGLAGRHARKMVCINGHPFTADNTLPGKKQGWRVCRLCKLATGRRSKARARGPTHLTFHGLCRFTSPNE